MLAQIKHGDSAPHMGQLHDTTAHQTSWVKVIIEQVPGL